MLTQRLIAVPAYAHLICSHYGSAYRMFLRISCCVLVDFLLALTENSSDAKDSTKS